MSRIREAFERARARAEGALIPYLTVGYPSPDETADLVRAVCAAGADIVELGVPFSDPLADGPTIQESSYVALQQGVTLNYCLRTVAALRQSGLTTPIVLMGYCNPFLAYGFDRLGRDLAAAGVDGLIVPDLPPELAGDWVAAMRPHGVDMIFFLAPTTSEQRMRSVVEYGSGFIYCISVTGVTGARHELPPDLPAFMQRVREATDLPLAVGFGISTPEHVRQVTDLADGAIVGSALINTLKRHAQADHSGAVRDFIGELKVGTRRLR